MTETVRPCIRGPHHFEPDHGHEHTYVCSTCGLRIAAIVFGWYQLGREDEARGQQAQTASDSAGSSA